MKYSIAALAGLASLSAAQTPTCVDGAYVIVARASGEKPGFGILGPVKDQILDRVPDSSATAVSYPATITNPAYTESEPEGVGNMTELVKAYGDACPEGRMVLMGYSQGAQVVGDVLLGNAIPFFPITQPLDEKYRNQVKAVILMGDPTFVKNEPVDVGNATNVSTFPRPNNDWEELGLVGRVQSYCDAKDYFCDRGDSIEVHVSYVYEYGNTAANYVVGKFNGSDSDGSSSMTPSATPTSSGASSTPAATETGASNPGETTGRAPTGTGAAPTQTGIAATMQVGNAGIVGSAVMALAFVIGLC